MRRSWQAFGVVTVAVILVVLMTGCDDGADANASPREVPHLNGDDVEVFFRLRATPQEVAAARGAIRRSHAVDRFAYVDRDEAIREFRRVFRDEPDLVATTKRSELPVSFRVMLRDSNDVPTIRRALEDLPGIDEIVDHRHPPRRGVKELMRKCEQLETGGSSDAEVFMNVLPSPTSQDAVQSTLERAPEVRRFQFLSQQDALVVFRRLFVDQPKLVATTTADQLPPSFRVWFHAGTSHERLLSELQAAPGVDEIKVADTDIQQLCRGT